MNIFKPLLALFLVLGLSLPVQAGFNLRQNDDGTADWIRSYPSGGEDKYPLGMVVVTGHMFNVAIAQTIGVAVPITRAKIVNIQAIVNGRLRGTSTVIDFYRSIDSTGGVFLGTEVSSGRGGGPWTNVVEVTNGTSRMTITAGGATGALFTFTPALPAAAGGIGTPNNSVDGNLVILIHSDGGSDERDCGPAPLDTCLGGTSVDFYITLVPR